MRTLSLCLLLSIHSVSSIYFDVVEGVGRCFLEELPPDTFVVGNYVNRNWDTIDPNNRGAVQAANGRPLTKLVVTATDAAGNQVVRHEMADRGRFAFTAMNQGEHKICIQPSTSEWNGVQRTWKTELDFEWGEEATDYSEIAKQEHLSAIEVEVRKLNDKIRDIRKEQEYQKKLEAAARDKSETVNERVAWFSILQTAVIAVIGVGQVFRLSSVIKKRRE